MYEQLPSRFQMRVHLQALVNALRRPTSDVAKLVRMTENAISVLDRAEPDEKTLRSRLVWLKIALEGDRSMDRGKYAAELDNSSVRFAWVPTARAPERRTIAA
jgi:hypothetical protein